MPDKGGAQGRRVGNRCYGCERHRSTEASCRPPGHGEYKVRPFKKRHGTEPGFRPEDRFASRKRNFGRARHAAGRWIRIRMHNDLYAAKVLECFECFGTTGQRFERVARTHDLHVARFKKRCALEVAREVHCREDAEVELARSQRGKRPFVVCANGDSRSRCDLGHGGKNRFDDHGERIIEAGNSKNALELGRRENGAVSEGSHLFENFACAKSERLRFVGRRKAAAVTLKEFRAEGRSDVSEETACFRLGNTEPFGCEPEIFHFYERANEFKLFFYAKVTVMPKPNGVPISYDVSRRMLITHGGVPVFGLYADFVNTVKVDYTRIFNGKEESFSDTYKIYASPIYTDAQGLKGQVSAMPRVRPVKVDPEFKDRLYLLNNAADLAGKAAHMVWNNPMGGALEWSFYPQNGIVDTTGEYRWYMFTQPIYNVGEPYLGGDMMGFRQNKDGSFTWGYGQRYVKYDLMGRQIWNRRLPINYIDFSHAMDAVQNGNYFLRVASSNTKLANGKNVRTVRDVIAEIDLDGYVVDEWRLFDILDPYRSDVIKALDQGAVCLNIDASKAGKTLSEEDIQKLNESDNYGDIAGTGVGRNWAHVNSVDYDPTDDSIIISSRHQSAAVKIGRDKKVKWILAAPRGWKGELAEKLLTPVDKDGKKLVCDDVSCEGGFDWTWTQHTAWRIDEKSAPGIVYLSVFDHGDARGMEQPAMPSMKYSRAVVYKIDEKKMTVEQIWSYGEEAGHDWFSPVTSLTEYHADKDSIFVYSATAGASFDINTGAFTSAPNPY